MAAVTKADLLAKRSGGTRKVDVPGVGQVEVRGLTRGEALSIQKSGALEAADMEALLISLAMVDPALTPDEVRQWQDVAPAGELEPISEAIQEMSGLKASVVKEQMQSFRG